MRWSLLLCHVLLLASAVDEALKRVLGGVSRGALTLDQHALSSIVCSAAVGHNLHRAW